MIIAVGSKNKIKIDAVRATFGRVYNNLTVQEVDVQSGVSTQPWGDDEIIKGAINRAKSALEIIEGDIGVGLEAGIVRNKFGHFTNAWCAICDINGKISLGGGFNVELPPQVVQDLEAGLDLGQAMSNVPTPYNHSAIGAIGVLTNDLFDRRTAYEAIVMCALAPYIRSDLYLEGNEDG